MNKKYQVFISSTYVDLKEKRQKVCDAILTLYQIPIGMEMFSADDVEQDYKNFKRYISLSDYPRHVDYLNNDYAPDLIKFMQSKISG